MSLSMVRPSTVFAVFLVLFSALAGSEARAQDDPVSPSEYLGYELGEQWTPHYRVLGYFKEVADTSPRVAWHSYGTSYEGRELIYVTVSTEENLARSEQIRTDNLKRAGLMEGAPSEDSTAIVWLSYNVHGDEASSSEAAMKTLYELARTGRWLQNTVVIMDPMLNPDGRDRYVHWYRETAGKYPDADSQAREHNQPWPSGRTNHYYFDLNRDWAWLTQAESRQRNEVYQQWLPHIHVDFHEQGYNAPYYFAPATEPFHKAITDWQREFQHTIGQNHASHFDRNNWLYFTREVFDLFYPSYGDTYPTFNGAIGMTYEQAGQVGLRIAQADGDTLTLSDRLTRHYTTGLSTVEVTSQNARQVVGEFARYYRDGRENPAGAYKTFVIDGDNDPDKLRNLFELLDRHRVAYGKAPENRSVTGYNYRTGRVESGRITGDDYLVSRYQPKSVLARIFFEPRPELTDSVTYDITAWGQHYARGLDGFALTTRIDPVPAEAPEPAVNRPVEETPYAYLARWGSSEDLKLLAALLNREVKVRYATESFAMEGSSYSPGTLIITRHDNAHLGSRFDRIVREAANALGQPIQAVPTGFADSGPDFGSDAVRFLSKPSVALLSGEGTSSYNVGEVWHFFDRQIGYPATLVNLNELENTRLANYDVLILPDGYYGEELERSLPIIRRWVKQGGRLIALRGGNAILSGSEGFALKEKEEEQAGQPKHDYNKDDRVSISDDNPGSIFRITVDPTHPLAYGYGRDYFSLKLDTDGYRLLDGKNGLWNVGIAEEGAHMSGFVGYRAKSELGNTLTFGVQEMGEGRVVYLVDNPLYRAFWQNGKLLFGNAVFMVNGSH